MSTNAAEQTYTTKAATPEAADEAHHVRTKGGGADRRCRAGGRSRVGSDETVCGAPPSDSDLDRKTAAKWIRFINMGAVRASELCAECAKKLSPATTTSTESNK